MKLFFALSLIFPAVLFANASSPAKAKVKVAYFGRVSDEEFNQNLKPLFNEVAKCKDCEIVNWTPYDKNKRYDDSKILEKVKQLDESYRIVFFDWNDRHTAHPEELLEYLQTLRGRQQMLVASAGVPPEDQKTCPLNLTLFGKVDEAIVIGELLPRDVLWPKCFYGPEMLTAVRPPREHVGKGYGPLIFTARFAGHFHKRSPEEWTQFFRMKKSKSRKLWPELEDFFPR